MKLNEHHGMLVAYNGGKVVDTTTNEVLYDKYIPDDLAMESFRTFERLSCKSDH